MILYACSDLVWATRVKATAESLGIGVRPVRSLGMLAERLADSDVRGMIVDLDAGTLAIDLIKAAAASGRGFGVVAFGPHVASDALAAAREAGAGRVLSRGAFAERLPQILSTLEAAADEPG